MFVKLTINESIAYITLNRPDRLNAYNSEMLDELDSAIKTVLTNQTLKAVVIGSSSDSFCTGADLKEIAHRSYRDVINLKSRRIFEELYHAPIISIAAVKGYAIAGGFELALACDFILAADNARFWLPEVDIGLIPAAGGVERLVQRVGQNLTKEIVICGRRLDTSEAQRLGLVTKTVVAAQLDDEMAALLKIIMAKPAWALQIAKISINEATSTRKSALNLFGRAFLHELRASKTNTIVD
jgi:enoyl-CoA hydratase/carnithine racemase